ncbi:hypothetical protein [Burkholderia territorii]|uniref:hypothetical protein n=1 Tax=Burkholderia territorii TaxID=1503055 RepID=UPI00075249A6|nr:hypothetical protein [Burkholderia territorii]KWA08204.1 hypothetical protein WT37_26475 [Burkholderia territorii]
MFTLRLLAVALPQTFPPESVHDGCGRFFCDFVPDLSKRQLLARTLARGWIPGVAASAAPCAGGFETFTFDLIVDGKHVTVIAQMQRIGKDVNRVLVSIRDPSQLPLF